MEDYDWQHDIYDIEGGESEGERSEGENEGERSESEGEGEIEGEWKETKEEEDITYAREYDKSKLKVTKSIKEKESKITRRQKGPEEAAFDQIWAFTDSNEYPKELNKYRDAAINLIKRTRSFDVTKINVKYIVVGAVWKVKNEILNKDSFAKYVKIFEKTFEAPKKENPKAEGRVNQIDVLRYIRLFDEKQKPSQM